MTSTRKVLSYVAFVLAICGVLTQAHAGQEPALITHRLKISVERKPPWWVEVAADGTIRDADGKLTGSRFQRNELRDAKGNLVLAINRDGSVQGKDHGATPLSFSASDELWDGDRRMWIDEHGAGFSQVKGQDKTPLYGVQFEGAVGRARRAALLLLYVTAWSESGGTRAVPAK